MPGVALHPPLLCLEAGPIVSAGRWPRPSPCAGPQTLVRGQPGAKLAVSVRFLARRRHLPIVTLERAE